MPIGSRTGCTAFRRVSAIAMANMPLTRSASRGVAFLSAKLSLLIYALLAAYYLYAPIPSIDR